MLRENDRVICVQDSVSVTEFRKNIEFPKKDRIYTVAFIDKNSKGEDGVYLKEIFNNIDYLIGYSSEKEPSFRMSRFRKINDEYLNQEFKRILKEAYLENQS